MIEFTSPSINYAAISPLMIIFGVAVVGVLVEAFAPRESRRSVQLVLSFGGIVAALVAVIVNASTAELTAAGAIAIDGPTLFLQGTLLLLALGSIALLAGYLLPGRGWSVLRTIGLCALIGLAVGLLDGCLGLDEHSLELLLVVAQRGLGLLDGDVSATDQGLAVKLAD